MLINLCLLFQQSFTINRSKFDLKMYKTYKQYFFKRLFKVITSITSFLQNTNDTGSNKSIQKQAVAQTANN